MLGLIFAAPLLALYTLLSEKVNEIMQDLDEYASLTLAKKS
jgi:biopolymer transport protein ExbB/TolQ